MEKATPRKIAAVLEQARQIADERDAGCRADCGWSGPRWMLQRHEEPPRSMGGWWPLLKALDLDGIIRRIVMLCPVCHAKRHPGPGGTKRLFIRILEPTCGTSGPLEFTETYVGGHRIWVTQRTWSR